MIHLYLILRILTISQATVTILTTRQYLSHQDQLRVFDPFTMPIQRSQPQSDVKIVQNLPSSQCLYWSYRWNIWWRFRRSYISIPKTNGIVQAKTDDGAGTYGPKLEQCSRRFSLVHSTKQTIQISSIPPTDNTASSLVPQQIQISSLNSEETKHFNKNSRSRIFQVWYRWHI